MPDQTTTAPKSNVPELSVSALSLSLQRMVEDSFGRVRVRGEIAGLKLAASGHLYAELKDENANLNIICWRSTMARLKIRPEEGLEVICTGKITTYPKSSRYQLIVESIELAGEGALLKMLEERKRLLAAEGLFAPERKKPVPFLPRRIGVVTSPTGAVIRDILHRLNDRFPRPVLLWPAAVQGAGAAEQIAAGIDGLNALPAPLRPDVIIVARGGGSLEDLMAFNEEIVVRAAAASAIPLISAVGHETDTTLLDYAADLRAPTPSAAAELAVPVRRDLILQVMDDGRRLYALTTRMLDMLGQRVQTHAARLGDPRRVLEGRTQALDHAGHRLDAGYRQNRMQKAARLGEAAARLSHPRQILAQAQKTAGLWDQRLNGLAPRLFQRQRQGLGQAGALLAALSFHGVLQRGFAVIRDAKGRPVMQIRALQAGQVIALQMQDGQRGAKIDD